MYGCLVWALDFSDIEFWKFVINHLFSYYKIRIRHQFYLGNLVNSVDLHSQKTDLKKQTRASADSSLVAVSDPSGFSSWLIVCLIFCFCLIYL